MNCLEAFKKCDARLKENLKQISQGLKIKCFPFDEDFYVLSYGIFKELTDHCCESTDDLHKFFMDYEMIIRLLRKWIEQLKQEGSNSKGMVLNDMIFYLGVLTGE